MGLLVHLVSPLKTPNIALHCITSFFNVWVKTQYYIVIFFGCGKNYLNIEKTVSLFSPNEICVQINSESLKVFYQKLIQVN